MSRARACGLATVLLVGASGCSAAGGEGPTAIAAMQTSDVGQARQSEPGSGVLSPADASRPRLAAGCHPDERGRCVEEGEPLPAVVQLFAQGPDYPLTPVFGRTRTRLLARNAVGAEVSPDGKTVLVVATGRGARLIPGGTIAGDYVGSSRFSPDSRYVALRLGGGKMAVFDVATPRLMRRFDKASLPVFVGGDDVVFRRGCRLYRATLTSLAQAEPWGPELCGSLLYADPELRRWIVAYAIRKYRIGTSVPYSDVWLVDPSIGLFKPLLAPAAAPVLSPLAAPAGNRVCASRVDLPLSALECRTLGTPRAEQVWSQEVHRLHDFDESGDRLLFKGAMGTRRYSLLLADFTARTVRYLGKSDPLRWRFLPGGRRVVGHGHEGIVLDLDQGWRAQVGPAGEWQGFAEVPGDPDRFILGRERGAGRDLYWVEMVGAGR